MDMILNLTTDYLESSVRAQLGNLPEGNSRALAERTQQAYVHVVERIMSSLISHSSSLGDVETKVSFSGVVYPMNDETLEGARFILAYDWAFRKYVGHVVGYSTTPLSDPESRLILHMSNGDRLTVYSETDHLVY